MTFCGDGEKYHLRLGVLITAIYYNRGGVGSILPKNFE